MHAPLQPSPPTNLLARAARHPHAWRVVLALLLVAVCYLALTPQPPREFDLGWDKLNHCAAFMALSVSGCFGFRGSRRGVLAVVAGLLMVGGLIELAQFYVPGRSSEWADLGADAIGIALGTALTLSMLKLAGSAEAR